MSQLVREKSTHSMQITVEYVCFCRLGSDDGRRRSLERREEHAGRHQALQRDLCFNVRIVDNDVQLAAKSEIEAPLNGPNHPVEKRLARFREGTITLPHLGSCGECGDVATRDERGSHAARYWPA
jgi:hypothetical protein